VAAGFTKLAERSRSEEEDAMKEWLYLSPSPDDSLLKRILDKGLPVKHSAEAPTGADLDERDFVLEAFADESNKKKVLRSIAEIALHGQWDGVVVSMLYHGSSTHWAVTSGLGERFVGFLPCPGPEDLLSVELLAGEFIRKETVEKAERAFAGIGLSVVVCGDQAGGILPRVLASTINEAAFMVRAGIASVEQIDEMMRLAANFPKGPFEWADHLGLDRVLGTLTAMREELGPNYQPCPWLRRKVEAGHLGVKSGHGFYRYPRKQEGGGR
jgi:3-hydroxybutyryl-CoA dehydrogenase